VKFRLSTGGHIVREINLPKSEWQKIGTPAEKRVWYKWVEIDGLSLQPRIDYRAELLVEDNVWTSGVVRTLPNRIPRRGVVINDVDRPFTVFVGSCYYQRNDPYWMVSDAYMKLWGDPFWQPDLKFLCGDQIYFDNPPSDFAVASNNPTIEMHKWVRERLTTKYRTTWEALDALLTHGATYMLTDDHEYWNDYPHFEGAPWVFSSWLPSPTGVFLPSRIDPIRDYLASRTEKFAEGFQLQSLSDTIKIGEDIEFFLLDTRRNRYKTRMGFSDSSDFSSAISWVENLKSPGVLVMSSPIFVHPTEVKFHLFTADHNLSYFFVQFDRLAQALLESKVDIVVVAGDPHFSRVAVARIDSPHRHRIIEIISSAMATVDGAEGDPKPQNWPKVFGMLQVGPQIPSAPIEYIANRQSILDSNEY
jgi:hypothetical protein